MRIKKFNQINEGKSKIKIITKVEVEQPSDEEALMELLEIVDSIGHDDIPFDMSWDDEDEYPNFKAYLIEEYGEEIKNYEEFILKCY